MTDELLTKGISAKDASYNIMSFSSDAKNQALNNIASALINNIPEIIAENKKDIEDAIKKGIKPAMIDRLTLDEKRIRAMADGVLEVAKLPDPIGEQIESIERPNGLEIIKKRVPIGVIAIIYEARPNVTADAAALCIKTSNPVILRGGSEAIRSNIKITEVMKKAVKEAGLPEGMINIIEDTSRTTASELMRMKGHIDLLIPRGSAKLIKAVVENATVPVIETGAGNCHLYIDKDCDLDMAISIAENAKVSRPSVCNACESILVHKDIAKDFLPRLKDMFDKNGVEIRACELSRKIVPEFHVATDEDFYTEYNDYIVSLKIVDSLEDAISHINTHNTKHSETIVTNDNAAAERFLRDVDAACVYHNASTRFTDGFEFGFGAEIGISTQKIHARGPLGLRELTSFKYLINGNGQIR